MALTECAWSLFHISVGSHNYDHDGRRRQIYPNDNRGPQTWCFGWKYSSRMASGKLEDRISEDLCDEGKPNVLQSGLTKSSTLEWANKKAETLSITVTIPMVRKAAMCAYRTE